MINIQTSTQGVEAHRRLLMALAWGAILIITTPTIILRLLVQDLPAEPLTPYWLAGSIVAILVLLWGMTWISPAVKPLRGFFLALVAFSLGFFFGIPFLYGNKVRIKGKDCIVAELESLHAHGWRGEVFFVDDNFIGNTRKLKKEFLPALTEWMERKRYPFVFNTEASIDLADDEELMHLMVQAGFTAVFVGIETPNEASLEECNKVQNKNRDLIGSVKKIQGFGLYVTGGFIIGFDNDPPSIFERLSTFIQESGIVSAMVGLLNAPRGSKLYERLSKEGRILQEVTGDNTDFTINFIPRMDYETLIRGYGRVINSIYTSEPYYQRIKMFLRDFQYRQKKTFQFHFYYLAAFFKTILFLGIIDEERVYYWKIFFWSLFKRTRLFPWALVFAVYGYQYRKVFGRYL